MLHRHHRGIGDQLAGNGEFVIGQGIDEGLARRHRLGAGEGQGDGVAGAGKGHAGPAALGMADQFGLAFGQLHQG